MRVIGIDVGKKGAIAIIETKPFKIIRCDNFPSDRKGKNTIREMILLFKQYADTYGAGVVYIENPNLGRHFGCNVAFVFGKGVGAVEVICEIAFASKGIPCKKIHPLTWQKCAWLIKRKGDPKFNTKKSLSLYLEKSKSEVKVEGLSEGVIDAVMIALGGSIHSSLSYEKKR